MAFNYIGPLRHGLLLYLILAASIGLHQFAQAKVAELLGDFLPRRQGRVAPNPVAHFDPIGTGIFPLLLIFRPLLMHALLFPVTLVGWGRPVEVSQSHPRTRRRNEILITLAGPGMNFLVALAVGIFAGLVYRMLHAELPWANLIISINCSLVAFNCIPLPPLDGSRVLRQFVAMSDQTFVRLSLVSPLILLVLVNISMMQGMLIHVASWAATPVYFCMYHLAGRYF